MEVSFAEHSICRTVHCTERLATGKILVVLIVRVKQKYLSQYEEKPPRSGRHRGETSPSTDRRSEPGRSLKLSRCAVSVIALAAQLTCKRDRAAFMFTSGIASLGKSQGRAMPGVTGCNLRSLCFVI